MEPDITFNRHRGDRYSFEANQSLKDIKSFLRNRIIRMIEQQGHYGATTEEVSETLRMPLQTASARMSELKAEGKIIPSGERRPTRSGRSAGVWISDNLPMQVSLL